jgi:hypothetical protein
MNQDTAKKLGVVYRSKTELMIEMLKWVEKHLPDQHVHFIGDYAYTCPAMLRRIPRRFEVTGRVHRRAQLHAMVTKPCGPKGRGRPRIRGERMESPEQMLQQRAKRVTLDVAPGRSYQVRMKSADCCFYQVPDRQIRVVALEHQGKRRENEAFYTTDMTATCLDIVRWYSRRWPIETMFQDCKQHLGLDAPRNRNPLAVKRTAPMGFMLYTLVVLWHESRQSGAAPGIRQYPGKLAPSFADMLAALRSDTLAEHREKHLMKSQDGPDLEKFMQYLETLLALAA